MLQNLLAHRPCTARPAAPLLLAAVAATFLLAAAPERVGAQQRRLLDRVESLDLARMEVGGLDVLYSRHPELPPGARTTRIRRNAELLDDARSFFAEALGRPFRATVVFLSPRHWGGLGMGAQRVPWSSQPDALVVIPVGSDLRPVLPPQDSAGARRVFDIISLHELGHVIASQYYHPAGYDGAQGPVLWFDELLASYLAHAYMVERKPELARHAQALAEDVVRRVEPRFSSLAEFERLHDSYLDSPQGGNTLGWYHNIFNLRAAELYEDEELDFATRVKTELPWVRLELWTSETLLRDLEERFPGFTGWAEELDAFTDRW